MATVTPSAGPDGAISPILTQSVQVGTQLTFTATPNTGYTVDTWSLDNTPVQTGSTRCTGGHQHLCREQHAHHQCDFQTAHLFRHPHSRADGTISPNTVQTVNYGSNLTLTATANSGYLVNVWSVDGTAVQVGGATLHAE